ncbi:hypothetical protein MMC28_002609 [Mycoblastus sanguinarius]|nr:hypothetical protein [Mycoblastus sanguinarius]
MPSQPPVSPLLLSYVSLPPFGSLTLLTLTLGVSTNWLLLRFLYSALKSKGHGTSGNQDDATGDTADVSVVLVSWLRDGSWWKEAGRKLVRSLQSKRLGAATLLVGFYEGIDFHRVHFVDGLSGALGLGRCGLADVEKEVLQAVESANAVSRGRRRVLLVLDGLDFLLAATECEVQEMTDMVGEFRDHVYSVLLVIAADLCLTQSPSTPLETSHAAFVTEMAHRARMIMSLRGLDTGAARDCEETQFKMNNWGMKAKRRKTTGTGRMRSMKEIPRKFKNGFQTGTPKGARGTTGNPM